jgi:4-hydroxy 2-oxovalerate aldolase
MLDILDCTLRDGGYINNWRFNNIFIENYIKIMKIMKIKYIEIGFINITNKYKNELVGNIHNLTQEHIELFQNNGFKLVIMADYNDINMKLLEQDLKIDLVRIAFHKNDLNGALNICKKIKDLGYKVSVNAMAITNYNKDELELLFELVNKYKLDILYIADSYGSLNQNKIKYYYELFSTNLKNTLIGFHLHNNMNNAYSNYEYLSNIYNQDKNILIDTTLFGMGRGAGNLQTELVYLNINKNILIDNIIKLLSFIQKFIKPIYKIEENNWGYDLDYLLSGYLQMHPNYIVKMRELNILMKNRFFLIKILKENFNYKTFDKNIIYELIEKYKEKLL